MAKKYLDEVGLNVEPTTRLGELSIAEQQQVEIAKALSLDAKILIFDEPTSSLTNRAPPPWCRESGPPAR